MYISYGRTIDSLAGAASHCAMRLGISQRQHMKNTHYGTVLKTTGTTLVSLASPVTCFMQYIFENTHAIHHQYVDYLHVNKCGFLTWFAKHGCNLDTVYYNSAMLEYCLAVQQPMAQKFVASHCTFGADIVSDRDAQDMATTSLLALQEKQFAMQYNPAHLQYAITFVHVALDRIMTLRQRHDAQYRYKIGYFTWEYKQLPEQYHAISEQVNEIWTPSTFCMEIFAPYSKVPVIRMPYIVDVSKYDRIHVKRSDLSIPEDAFVFVSQIDYHEHPELSNVQAVMQAFDQAFPLKKKTKQLLYILALHATEQQVATLQAQSNSKQHIRIISQFSKQQQMALKKTANAYVSLHYSTSFGNHIAESMALGTPVLATSYSGNMDYTNAQNSFLVHYTMKEDELSKQQLAHVKLDHASKMMQLVVQNSKEAQERAQRAKRDMQDMYSAAFVTARMQKRLSYVNHYTIQKA